MLFTCVSLLYSQRSYIMLVGRVPFISPTQNEYLGLFTNRQGALTRGAGLGDIKIYRPSDRYRRGGGIFSTLLGLGKRAMPFIAKYILPTALDTGKKIAHDVSKGTSLRKAFKKRGLSAAKEVGSKLIRGGNNARITKRKRSCNKTQCRKKTRYKRDFLD